MEFFPEFPYSKSFSRNMNKFNNFLNIIVQGAEKLLIIWMFLQCCFQNFFCSILFPDLDRYSAVYIWKYISFIITLKQSYIYQNFWMYVSGCFDIRFPGTTNVTTRIWNLSLLQKAMSVFYFFLNKVIKSFSPLNIFRWWFCRDLPIRSTFDAVSVFFSKFSPTRGAKKCDTIPFILNWLDIFFLCVVRARIYIKNRDFWKYRSGFLEWNQGF